MYLTPRTYSMLSPLWLCDVRLQTFANPGVQTFGLFHGVRIDTSESCNLTSQQDASSQGSISAIHRRDATRHRDHLCRSSDVNIIDV